jgi:hypothetical protein
MAQHVGVHPGHSHPGDSSEVLEPPGGGVAVHSGAGPVEQDWPMFSLADGAVDRSGDGRRQWYQGGLAAFAEHAQHPVTMFLAEVADVGSAGFEDPQPEQAEHCDQGEVTGVGRGAGGDEHRFELQVRQP